MDITPRCGEIKYGADDQARLCGREWFHEGAHLAHDGLIWDCGHSDERGWLEAYPEITRPLSPAEFFGLVRGPIPNDVTDF